jgi:DNA polymerase III epsilon subunit family exonuclease
LSSYSRVLEIGAVRFRPGGAPETFSTLIKSGMPIQPRAAAIHGIDESMLASAPPPEEAVPDFLEFSRGCVLVAHNARFDTSVLSRELAILGLDPPGHAIIDSLPLARRYFKTENYRLATLVEHLQIPVHRLHRALPDAFAVYRIMEDVLMRDEGLALGSLENFVGLCGGMMGWHKPRKQRNVAEARLIPAALLPALDSGSLINISYGGGSKGAALRPVRPLRITRRQGVEYLDAYCLIDNRRKFFRLDLIKEIL